MTVTNAPQGAEFDQEMADAFRGHADLFRDAGVTTAEVDAVTLVHPEAAVLRDLVPEATGNGGPEAGE